MDGFRGDQYRPCPRSSPKKKKEKLGKKIKIIK